MDRLLEGTPYRAVARLGSGGMGEIYDAVDKSSSGRIVVKLLRHDLRLQADMIDRMRVEGEALELLRHPNIVIAHGHGTTVDGRPYVAMERLEGVTLQSELRRRGALPLAEALHHARQLLSALKAVHEAGIVHRDIKPENVMLTRQMGQKPQIKLLDFGVAKVAGGPGAGRGIAPLAFPTQAGACIGTPRYASPEQARGASVDRRTDIYAAGIVLYMLVAGRGPFDEIKGAGNVLRAHATEEPPPPSRFTRYPIPGALESVILRAIAKNPDDRFSDAPSFSRELLVTIGKMCLPSDLMASPGDIATALNESRARATPAPDARDSDESGRVPAGPRPGSFEDAPTVLERRTHLPEPEPLPERVRASVSGPEVLLSAAAFALLAGGVAMWFAH
jgi:serine/threonine-protein kinase